MLVTLLIWLLSLLILAGWGYLFALLLGRLLRGAPPAALNPAVLLLCGFAAATTLAAFISLVAPTGLLTFTLLALGTAGGWYLARRAQPGIFNLQRARAWLAGFSPLVAILLLVAFASVLNAATLKTANPDTGIYHAQTVRWIESYPAVPGLGNLHTRLAYNSAWFVTNAAFSLAWLQPRSFHLSSSLFFLIALLYFLTGANDLLKGRAAPAGLLKTALFPLSTYLLARDISSPSPDLPAALLVWVCVTLYVETVTPVPAGAYPARTRLNDAALAVLAVFAVTVKLSTLPVLLLPLLRLLRKDRRFVLTLAGLAAVILLPWLARNLILSGYPLFPGPALDLFHFDWRIPADIARAESTGITSWARESHLPGAEVRAMPLHTWSRLWFNNLTPNRQLLFLAALFSPAPLLGSGLLGLALRRRLPALWALTARLAPAWTGAYAGVAFWFFSAPAMRFGYGFLVAAALLAALPLLTALAGALLSRIRWLAVLVILLLLAYQAVTLGLSLDTPTFSGRLVLPTDYTNLPTQPCRSDHLTLTCASQWQECGYEAFPCVPALDPFVTLRGKSLREGFRSLEVP